MILTEFSYRESSGWQLENLTLHPQNLIVGMNAVGKTRTLEALGNVIRFIKNDFEQAKKDFSCVLHLSNSHQIEYSFELSGGLIKSERLEIDGQPKIIRSLTQTEMYGESVNPPANKLVIQARRDTMRYPEIEEIILWAEHTSLFVFSNITASPKSLSPYLLSTEPLMIDMYEQIKDQQPLLIDYVKQLGYPLEKIEEVENASGVKTLLIYETGIEKPMLFYELSNGMFRVFCILLYMIYSSTLAEARCLMIDDMGEGLDYQRSTKLGEIMFRYCKERAIQLIVTSNDSFLMDSIDLEYWNILQRTGSTVTSLNSKNNQELFTKFVRTGLSNFDFLSSNFIVNHLQK